MNYELILYFIFILLQELLFINICLFIFILCSLLSIILCKTEGIIMSDLPIVRDQEFCLVKSIIISKRPSDSPVCQH